MNARQAAFQKAMQRGRAASPFTGEVTVIMGATRHRVCGLVSSGDNKAQVDEFGLEHVRTLEAHLPKCRLPRRPDASLDAVEYLGRSYKLASIKGGDACSDVWVISAVAPF